MDAFTTLAPRFERRLAAAVPAGTGPLAGAVRHILLAPSKRVRAALICAAGEALGADPDALVTLACATELTHAASLLLDDLPCMDDARRRRGRPCAHLVYGEAVATLAAVAMLNEAHRLLASCPAASAPVRAALVRRLAESVGPLGLVGGQTEDLDEDADRTLAEAEEVARRKTGALFVFAACGVGEIVALDAAGMAALEAAAVALGLAFQTLDDLRDGGEALACDPGKDAHMDRAKRTVGRLAGEVEALTRIRRQVQRAVASLEDAGCASPSVLALVERCFGDALRAAERTEASARL